MRQVFSSWWVKWLLKRIPWWSLWGKSSLFLVFFILCCLYPMSISFISHSLEFYFLRVSYSQSVLAICGSHAVNSYALHFYLLFISVTLIFYISFSLQISIFFTFSFFIFSSILHIFDTSLLSFSINSFLILLTFLVYIIPRLTIHLGLAWTVLIFLWYSGIYPGLKTLLGFEILLMIVNL